MNEPFPSFFKRLGMAFVCFFRLLFSPRFGAMILPEYRAWKNAEALQAGESVPTKIETTPEKEHASALYLLGMLQREGRVVDFLQEEVATFSDAEVGAAARIVYQGC